jgi:hypothetical protein
MVDAKLLSLAGGHRRSHATSPVIYVTYRELSRLRARQADVSLPPLS